MVAELNADVRAAGVKDAIIVGHSLAGVIVPRMVTADPDLYSQVVMLTTAAPKEGDTIVQLMGSGVHGSSGTAVGFPLDPTTTPRQDQFRPMFCEGMDEADITWLLGECAQDHWPMCVATEPVTRAGFIGLRPVTFIVTLRDGILPVPWQGRFAERFGPDTAIVSIDTPHEPFITHPRLVADTLAAIALGQR